MEQGHSTLRRRLLGGLAAGLASVGGSLKAQTTQSQFGPFGEDRSGLRAQPLFEGLENPWAFCFLPDRSLLVTERPGRMRLMQFQGQSAQLSAPLQGLPEVHAMGQGGLLDVITSSDFARDQTLFFSLAQPTDRGARTAIFRAQLKGLTLSQVQLIFAQKHDPSGRHHFGCRLLIASDGMLYASMGERFFQAKQAQSLDNHFGKVIRIGLDGGVPGNNPFVGKGDALAEIYSYGHRNPQGLASHPQTQNLWMHEHGPQGGDELNILAAGRNYGWPSITYGREYVTNLRIGEGTSRADVQPPLHYWIPSIAPSGLCFVRRSPIDALRGGLLIGSLKERCLAFLRLQGDRVIGEQRLLTGLNARVRDVRESPTGELLFITDESRGALLRLSV
ncbi:MAG: PQQ-dependent sugar dehydrogenase [Betaproteobacteria bacterium]|nr:PQQ-dependent sugar dehydrogenase [Betaproteobacteria bacterium]